jgi:hypothetical protein
LDNSDWAQVQAQIAREGLI